MASFINYSWIDITLSPVLKSKVPRSAYAEAIHLQASQAELSLAGRRMGVILLDLGTGLWLYKFSIDIMCPYFRQRLHDLLDETRNEPSSV